MLIFYRKQSTMNPCAMKWARASCIARNKHPTEPSRQPLQLYDKTKLKNSMKLYCNCASILRASRHVATDRYVSGIAHSIINFSALAYNLIHRDSREKIEIIYRKRGRTVYSSQIIKSDSAPPYELCVCLQYFDLAILQRKNECNLCLVPVYYISAECLMWFLPESSIWICWIGLSGFGGVNGIKGVENGGAVIAGGISTIIFNEIVEKC